jgi:ABC-type branched-subunit amino acid transport system ATPase component/branched-subunit amino acid ABC-type transport system permease component
VHNLLPFIVIGLTTGSVYGLAGVGLVLTYKTSGIFNFAHGSVATLSVFVFYFLRTQHHWPWPAAAVVSVFVLGPLLGVLLELMARVLASASDVLKIAATIGLVIIVLAVGDLWYGSVTNSFPAYLPTSTIRVLGVNVGWDQITVILIALLSTAALYYFFRFIRLGVAMRGVVDDPSLIAMTGESPVVVRRWAWVIGATFASLSGVLLAPSLSLNGLILTELVVQAFGAAAIGYFSSLPLTYVGGLVIGILGSLATKYVAQVPSLSGLPPGLPFIILFLVLIFTPRAVLAARRYVPNIRIADPYYAPPRIRAGSAVVAVVVLALIPSLVGAKLAIYSSGLIDVILFISLGLLVRISGQVSLCQYGFAAVGAAAMGHFAHGLGIPWLLSLLLAGLVAVPIGAIIAIPAIRLSGVFLALATLGFGILLEQMFYTMHFMFGPTTAGIPVPRPNFSIGPLHMETDKGFYYVILFFAVLSALIMVGIMKSRLGRILGAMSDSPLALETLGTTVNVSKVLVFCISSFMAAIAGALAASLFSFAVGSEYASFSSLTLVALIAIIPFGAPWFALVAGAGLEVIPAYINLGKITDYLQIFFGVSALLAPLTLARHPGAPQAVRRLADRLDAAIPRRSKPPAPALDVPHTVHGVGLEVRDLTVRYGGAIAVSELSLTAPTGRITGLIGPNGAGKTTTFNAACGLLRPSEGRIFLHGQDVSDLGPAARARRGLGRTFQRVELFNSLTVRENIQLGREAILAGANPLTQLAASPAEKGLIRAAAEQAIALTGVAAILERKVGDISTGQRRLVELARVLAGPFDMILLDEPSSGLDAHETEHFGRILSQVVSEWGIGILLVEHDMALVRQVCDQVWVLDFGRLIYQGPAAAMLESEIVKAAYLGSEGVESAAAEVDELRSQPQETTTGTVLQ